MTTWPVARLDEFCVTGSGGTPSRDNSARYYDGGTIPWVKSGELKESLIMDTSERITPAALTESSTKLVPPGAILLAMYGATIGRLGMLGIAAATNQAVCHIIPDPESADSWYVFHALRSQLDGLVRRGAGGAQPNISQTIVKEIQIPLPPIDEQLRIVAILDHADALRAKRRAALDEVDVLTGSVFNEMFGNPTSNPKGFPLGTLGDIATFVGGGTPSRAVPQYFTGSICWATSKDMKARYLDDTQEHVTSAAVQASATKVVPPGTILVVVKSKVLMRRLPVAISRVDTCFGQDLKGIVLDERCHPAYVATALRMNASWLLKRARGINTEGLTLDHLRRFPLLLPSRSKQQDFGRFANENETLHQQMSASINELDALYASLQHRAFRGGL